MSCFVAHPCCTEACGDVPHTKACFSNKRDKKATFFGRTTILFPLGVPPSSVSTGQWIQPTQEMQQRGSLLHYLRVGHFVLHLESGYRSLHNFPLGSGRGETSLLSLSQIISSFSSLPALQSSPFCQHPKPLPLLCH